MAERKKTAVARPRPEEGGRGQEQSKGQGLVSGRSRGHGSEATELEGVVGARTFVSQLLLVFNELEARASGKGL